jgi:3-dehydroquinate synthetase
LALGGGVIGDIAGFSAASTLRGLPFVQLPTTLLAMVDSSVGGKTGVNHPRGKNLIGAFHQPRLVYAAFSSLQTLPEAERIAGMGEVVKTALLGDAALFALLEQHAEALRAGSIAVLAPVVARCVTVKADVVARDERETGWRAVLNAGHTVGHAYETATGHGTLRHGEAVALGLVAEAQWAVENGHCSEVGLPERLTQLHRRLGLPVAPPVVALEKLLTAIRVDKKARGNILQLPVPVRVGKMKLIDFDLGRSAELFQREV